jgi:hypothetical protein
MIDQGRGGAIVITSSAAGITGIGGNTPADSATRLPGTRSPA